MTGKPSFINKVVMISVALGLLFVMLGSLVLPFFNQSYQFCQDSQWVGTHGGDTTNCTRPIQTSNATAVLVPAGSHHVEGGFGNVRVAADTDYLVTDGFCLTCATEGGYRTANRGLVLLVLVIAIIAAGVYFMPRSRW